MLKSLCFVPAQRPSTERIATHSKNIPKKCQTSYSSNPWTMTGLSIYSPVKQPALKIPIRFRVLQMSKGTLVPLTQRAAAFSAAVLVESAVESCSVMLLCKSNRRLIIITLRHWLLLNNNNTIFFYNLPCSSLNKVLCKFSLSFSMRTRICFRCWGNILRRFL